MFVKMLMTRSTTAGTIRTASSLRQPAAGGSDQEEQQERPAHEDPGSFGDLVGEGSQVVVPPALVSEDAVEVDGVAGDGVGGGRTINGSQRCTFGFELLIVEAEDVVSRQWDGEVFEQGASEPVDPQALELRVAGRKVGRGRVVAAAALGRR